MTLQGKRIGFGITGSHCTYSEIFPQIEKLVHMGADVIPIVTATVKNTGTRFGKPGEWVEKIEEATARKVIDSIESAEPLGPKMPLDCMVVAPITGNSLSKLANALTDSPVLMAAKATMRTHRPVVLGISTNDALGLNGQNIMKLLATKNIYFVPFGQDNPHQKPNSMVASMDRLTDTVEAALAGKQLQPVIIEKFREET
ncbi:dipicolinate synthase subunit B [Bacillus xiapuensis]|uniref:dipicolinate synthase subunit B n=1 Tax=Bacillus xiapuensis TaxID=2014075 RepID=UPI000C240507|nr:dipicolinate synthase subunit B [Bacillus xiapuensis]